MTDKRKAAWPDRDTMIRQMREGVFDDSELRTGLLNMASLPDADGEVPPEIERHIRREANRIRHEEGLPPLPYDDK